jgi:hypothetical protein
MRIITIASQQCGVGKTTLAAHLAVEAERTDAGPVAVVDTDPQGSLAAWWNTREAPAPLFASVEIAHLPDHLRTLQRRQVEFVVIDTPPALGSVPDLLTWVLDWKCEFIAIHEETKDDIIHHDGFRKTDGLPCQPLDAGAQGEMLALDLLCVLLPDFMGFQTQMPLIHASVIGVKS